MNKEEIKKMFSVLTEQWGDTDNYVNDLLCYSKELQKENEKLKKQLETYEIEGHKQEEELDKMSFDIRKYKTQQKVFIKWLEDYLNLFDYRDIQEQAGYDMLEEILQKYKEIIGDDK